MPAADIDVLPVKKAHIRIPVLRAIAACPDAAEHLGRADFSVEVGDRRGISAPTLNGVRTEWIRGREIEVKKAETVNRRPAGYGIGQPARRRRCDRTTRFPESGAEHRNGCRRGTGLDELPPCQRGSLPEVRMATRPPSRMRHLQGTHMV